MSVRECTDDEAAAAHVAEPAGVRTGTLRGIGRTWEAALTAVAAVYEAAYDERLWPQALRRLCAACRADGAAVVLVHGRARQRVVIAHGISDAALRQREAAWQDCAAFRPAEDVPQEAAGGQWLTAALPLEAPDGACLHLRTTVQRQRYFHRRGEVLDSLVPHVAGALRLALARARETAASAQQAMEAEALPLGRLLLDASDQVVGLNRPARKILDAADGLILADDRLLTHSPNDDALLRRALRQARERGESSMLSIHRRHGRRPYTLRIAPATPPADALFAERASMLELLLVSREEVTVDLAFAAACWPELSRGERRVLERLLLGDGIEQCAEHLHIARGTAKLHVEHIFRKIGVRRRSELLRLSLLPFVTALPGSPP
jgi:DNA-binding CsgD family transcriptional regulator